MVLVTGKLGHRVGREENRLRDGVDQVVAPRRERGGYLGRSWISVPPRAHIDTSFRRCLERSACMEKGLDVPLADARMEVGDRTPVSLAKAGRVRSPPRTQQPLQLKQGEGICCDRGRRTADAGSSCQAHRIPET